MPELLVNSLLEAADNLCRLVPSVKKITFCQLIPRHRGTKYNYMPLYNEIACEVNDALLNRVFYIRNRRLLQWEIPFPMQNITKYVNSRHRIYRPDGVHLNGTGLYRFCRAIRSILAAVNRGHH